MFRALSEAVHEEKDMKSPGAQIQVLGKTVYWYDQAEI